MNPHVEVEMARRYLVRNHQSQNHFSGWSRIKGEGNSHPGGERNDQKWQSIPTRILAASPHLQGYDVPGEEIDKLKAEGLTLLEALEELGLF